MSDFADFLLARIAEDPDRAPALVGVGDPARIEAGWIDDDALRVMAEPFADHPDYPPDPV